MGNHKYSISKKLLTDGALYREDNKAVSSYILSNGRNEISRGVEIFNYEGKESEYVEARAIRLGVERALSLGVTHISVGTDSANIVDAVREETNLRKYNDVQEIVRLARKADTFGIYHLSREDVEEAHELARSMYNEMD